MGKADYFADGSWNFYCDFCGAKAKSSTAQKTWNNYYVCRHHKEVRNPQDFLRGVKDDQSVPWSRPESFIPLAFTRSFIEPLPLAEVTLKTIGKVIAPPVPPPSSGAIDAFAFNTATIDGPLTAALVDPEQLLLTEGVIVGLLRIISPVEVLPLAESFTTILKKSLAFAEALPLVETTILRKSTPVTFAETLPIAETFAKLVSRNLSFAEALPIAEVVAKQTGKTFAEALPIAESVTVRKVIPLALSDTVLLVESFSTVLSHYVTVFESLPIIETLIIQSPPVLSLNSATLNGNNLG